VAEASKSRWVEGYVREADAMRVSVGQKARIQVPANVGRFVNAEVSRLGFHTEALDGSAGVTELSAGKPDRVWVRLVPLEPFPGEPVTGTTARVIIRVR
jgi:hypothetical protein